MQKHSTRSAWASPSHALRTRPTCYAASVHQAASVAALACALALGCGAGEAPAASDARAAQTDAHADLIRLTQPRVGDEIASPLVVTGEARGTWFFEATFPVRLLDASGALIVEHYAQAQGEWMTEAFVPFRAELRFESPATATGTLVLQKSNPSDMREHDDELRVPVRFVPAHAAP